MFNLNNDWKKVLESEFQKPYFKSLEKVLMNEYENFEIYPKIDLIFNGLNLSAPKDIKVVILGQDPYHEPSQAHGLAFSVENDIKLPPSLQNIYKELQSELGITNTSGNLTKWAKQGVLLLNTTLTVRRGQANSHKDLGWQNITRAIISYLNENFNNIIFVLWGKNAQALEELINKDNHFILKSAHPSPLSAYNGFWGNGHFKQINEILISLNKSPIDFQL